MKTIAAFIIIVLTASSCATQKRCLQKWPPEIIPIDTLIQIQIKDTVIFRDTIVPIYIKGETDTSFVEIPCDFSGNLKTVYDTATAETTMAIAKAWIEPGPPGRPARLRIELQQKDTTIMARLDSAIREAEHWKQETIRIKQTYTKPVFKPTAYYRFTSSAFWGSLFINLLFIAGLILVIRTWKKKH